MRPQPESSNTEVLAGLVERVTYHNSENGFCVLRAKVRGHRDMVTVVGHAAAVAAVAAQLFQSPNPLTLPLQERRTMRSANV
jgi:hypothetical protein